MKAERTCFVGMVPLYFHKSALKLTGNAIVAYPRHLVLLKFAKEFLSFLVDYGHAVVGLGLLSRLDKINKQHEM